MKTPLSILLGFALGNFFAPLLAQGQSTAWKVTGSETLPAPGEGVAHQVQTLARPGTANPYGATAATLHFVSFKSSRYTFAVFDQTDLGRASLGEMMGKKNCLAGTNGGYFQPDFEPVGLLLSEGKLVKKPSHVRLLSGALISTGQRISLRRSQQPLPGKNARDAVQAGPFLVEFGKVVPGLNNVRSARRTAVFTVGKHVWGLVSSSGLTLDELGAVLADPALLPGGLRIDQALNLDGGSSTGLWARQGGKEPFYLREIGIVRDFVGIVPRQLDSGKPR